MLPPLPERPLCLADQNPVWWAPFTLSKSRLGGSTRLIILDNLREAVIDLKYCDPTLNPLFLDLLAHYGEAALRCRVHDPDRKGKWSVA